MSSKSIAIVGAGGRGREFARMFAANPKARVGAVAEPRADYRQQMALQYGVPNECVFPDWRALVAARPRVDAVFIGTPDGEHVGPALACMDLGYDVLLEKPMGVSLDECQRIEARQRATGRIVAVCHSLRYQAGFRRVKEVLDSGRIGRPITVDLIEQVAWWHQAHSFVRGNWGNSSRSTFMLLAKSCHDIDYLHYLLGRRCLKVSSFGALTYFRPENAPANAGERCVDCAAEPSCRYSAIRHYVDGDREAWPAGIVSLDHSREAHYEAIRTGPYGRCVWKCDNDVVDHQTVNLLFQDDVTATFTMTAFTSDGGRRLRINGALGELAFDEKKIVVRIFGEDAVETINLTAGPGTHGGGDQRIADEFVDALHSRDDTRLVANAQESLKTHSVVFAAEKSRLEGRTIDLVAR